MFKANYDKQHFTNTVYTSIQQTYNKHTTNTQHNYYIQQLYNIKHKLSTMLQTSTNTTGLQYIYIHALWSITCVMSAYGLAGLRNQREHKEDILWYKTDSYSSQYHLLCY